MTAHEIRPETEALHRAMAGDRATRAKDEFVLHALGRILHRPGITESALAEALCEPFACLRAIYGHYAFARRGKERQVLSEIALEALRRTTEPDNVGQFLSLDNAQSLWYRFEEVCLERRHKPMPQLNAGIIAGMAELAQEIYRVDGAGSIALWLARSVEQTHHLETPFLRMVDVRGVGPKLASLFTRDVMAVFGLEAKVDFGDRLYLQPIDKWIRLIAPYAIEEPGTDEMADWVLAGKISKYARRAGVSGIRFNMGVTYFGLREVRDASHLGKAVREAVAAELTGQN